MKKTVYAKNAKKRKIERSEIIRRNGTGENKQAKREREKKILTTGLRVIM
jgi:hypothetical protein